MDLLHVAIRSVADIETKLCILVRWDSNHPEFKATAAYMKQRDFHRALDKLQQLVVQRLFELSKANAIAMGKSRFNHIFFICSHVLHRLQA